MSYSRYKYTVYKQDGFKNITDIFLALAVCSDFKENRATGNAAGNISRKIVVATYCDSAYISVEYGNFFFPD